MIPLGKLLRKVFDKAVTSEMSFATISVILVSSGSISLATPHVLKQPTIKQFSIGKIKIPNIVNFE